MQETIKISYMPAEGTWQNIVPFLVDNIKRIEELLVRYHYSRREKVLNVSIDQDKIFVDQKGMGSFTVSYVIGLFNACADLDFNDKAAMKIGFRIQPDSHEIILTGENIPEREPDE